MTREEMLESYRHVLAMKEEMRAQSQALGYGAATRAYNALSMAALHLREVLGIERSSDHD